MSIDISLFSTVAALCLGVSLAAATGFRLFVPCLVVSLAARCGLLHLSPNWEWIGSWPALITLGSATLIEVAAYYIPWVDNALDSIAGFAAPVIGTLLVVAVIPGDVKPVAAWTLAIVGGGGTALAVQAKTTAVRALSTALTGGLANPVVSTLEVAAAVVISVLAVLLPVAAAALVVIAILSFWVFIARKLLFRRPVST